jgi:[acyl-carrier-protein] S-malonyltransferase
MAEHTALLFPGQGTQSPGMGNPFLHRSEFSIAREAGDILGLDVEKLLCDESPDALSSTRNAQLAILITSLMSYESLKQRGFTPICFAGHSLGQVTALICAGVISREEGLVFAAKRADATQQCADKYPGAMAALLGADTKSAQALCDNFVDLWIANDNAPGQIVIAGSPQSIEKASEVVRDYEIKKAVVLPVNGAFHTPYMTEAAEELQEVLSTMTFNTPVCGVASNDDGRAYTTSDVWQEKLSVHVARPVKWRDCMDAVALLDPAEVFEVGYGSTLAGLAKRCTPDLAVLSWYGEEK